MKQAFFVALSLLAAPAFAGSASEPPIAQNCAANVLLFADQTFATTAEAQAACQQLVAQANANQAECKVQNLQGGKKRARLRKNRRVNGNGNNAANLFGAILQDLQNVVGLANGLGVQISQAQNSTCQ